MASREKTNWYNSKYADNFSTLSGYFKNELGDVASYVFNDSILYSCSSDTLMVGDTNVFETMIMNLFKIIERNKSAIDSYLQAAEDARKQILEYMEKDADAALLADKAYDDVMKNRHLYYKRSLSVVGTDTDASGEQPSNDSEGSMSVYDEDGHKLAAEQARESTWEANRCGLW